MKTEAIAELQERARKIGWLVEYDTETGAVQLYSRMSGIDTIEAIRDVLKGVERRRAVHFGR